MVRLITETMFQSSINLQKELKERRRIEIAMQRRADEMTLLYQLNISLASGKDLQSTLLALQSEIERLIKADAFMVAFYDQKTDVVSYPIFFERGELVYPPDRIYMMPQVLAAQSSLIIKCYICRICLLRR